MAEHQKSGHKQNVLEHTCLPSQNTTSLWRQSQQVTYKKCGSAHIAAAKCSTSTDMIPATNMQKHFECSAKEQNQGSHDIKQYSKRQEAQVAENPQHEVGAR